MADRHLRDVTDCSACWSGVDLTHDGGLNAGVAGHGAVQFVPNYDRGFAAGITGIPGFVNVVIPADWRTRLNPSDLDLLIKRRIAARYSVGWSRGILWAMLWNIISFTVAILLTGDAIVSFADLVTTFFIVPVTFVRGLATTARAQPAERFRIGSSRCRSCQPN